MAPWAGLMWCLLESSLIHATAYPPFAQSVRQDLRLGGKAKDVREFAKRAIEKGVVFVPGLPCHAADADRATLRLSFATADVGKILEGVGRLGRAI